MKGFFRVVGSEKWITKTTVTQDNGQGPTGATSTTINVEATDEMPAPFYSGIIETEDGDFEGEPFDDSDDGLVPVYDNVVTINGLEYNVSVGEVSIHGPLTSMNFTGENMLMIKAQLDMNTVEMAVIANDGASASWLGNVAAPATVLINRRIGNTDQLWFILDVNEIAYD